MQTPHWIVWLVVSLFTACGCATTQRHQRAIEESNMERMLQSTVQIRVAVALTLIKGPSLEGHKVASWTGSGVIIGRNGGHSIILTANHVLEAPTVGSQEVTEEGLVRVDAVLMQVTGYKHESCSIESVALGSNDTHDVAVGLAQCDLGPVARVGSTQPPIGARIVVTGHPMGIPTTMVSEGVVAGLEEGYWLASAAIFGGSSGGPVWYDGEVVGIVVRGVHGFANASLSVPLTELHARIAYAEKHTR